MTPALRKASERQTEGGEQWLKHDGGSCPVDLDSCVDLIWGFGIIRSQPATKVNWRFLWDYHPS